MTPRRDPYAFLATAARYVELFRNGRHLFKVSGELLANARVRDDVIEQCVVLHRLGLRFVLVHGGGPQIDRQTKARGLTSHKIAGRRLTTPAQLEIIRSVYDELRADLVEGFRSRGIAVQGLTASEAGVQARRRGPVDVDGQRIDFGEVGDLAEIEPQPLCDLWEAGVLPIVSPLCRGEEGRLLNVNADTVAAGLAIALGVAKLVFLVGVPGLLRDPTRIESLVHFGDRAELEALMIAGACREGMAVKSQAILTALDGGVAAVHLVDGNDPHALLRELLTTEGAGTMLVRDRASYQPVVS